jgi:hypothetical protein
MFNGVRHRSKFNNGRDNLRCQPWLHIDDGLPNFTEAEMAPVVEGWKAERS